MKDDVTTIKKRLVDHYNDSAFDYHEDHYAKRKPYSPLQCRQQYVEKMIEEEGIPKGARILDVGCGPGELLLSLARKGHEDLRGIDISTGMVEKAIAVLESGGGRFADQVSVGDIENLAFDDGYFDVVVASGVLEYQKNDDKALGEMQRVLKPSGYLILNVTNRFAYVNLLDNTYRWLKRRKVASAAIGFLKNRILRKGPLNAFPDRRTHLPGAFDQALRNLHFEKIRYNYFHFSPVPTPIDSVFEGLSGRLGRRMEMLTNSSLAPLLAGGYLVMARKEGGRAADRA